MSVLIIFIKLIAVFDLLVIAVYFGGDILSTMLNKLRRKPKQDDPFDFSLDTVTVSLSIDSIRQLCSDDAADFVEEKILPNAEKTMVVLTEQEQTAARLLLSALIGFLAAEAPMDEQSFPLMMELLNCMEGEKEDGCQDAVDSLLEDAACNTRRHEEYYSNYSPRKRSLHRRDACCGHQEDRSRLSAMHAAARTARPCHLRGWHLRHRGLGVQPERPGNRRNARGKPRAQGFGTRP